MVNLPLIVVKGFLGCSIGKRFSSVCIEVSYRSCFVKFSIFKQNVAFRTGLPLSERVLMFQICFLFKVYSHRINVLSTKYSIIWTVKAEPKASRKWFG